MGDISQLTAIIKTFQRPRSLDRLIRSIRRYYSHLAIAVADDGIIPTPRTDVDYLRLPADIGLSAGRNALLRHIRTPYFLLLDDDLEFTSQTRIERLLELVSTSAVKIAGGDYYRCKRKLLLTRRRWQPFHGTFDFRPGELQLSHQTHAKLADYELCDFVHNFFVASTADILALGGWDEELKLNEHVEFFVRVRRQNLPVAYCAEVIAHHWMERNPEYTQYRDRDFTGLASQKIGVRAINRFDGQPIAAGSRSRLSPRALHAPRSA